jgi:histidine triad (HIT) family protein
MLVVPRQHFSDLTAMAGHTELIGKMHGVALSLAKEHGIEEGFRIVINCKEKGGQTVMHVHLHLMGGKKMGPGLSGN